MSAAEALKAARAAGIELALDGDDLALSAASEPPAAVLDAVSRHKAQIVALLRPGRDGWSGEDWLAFFDERAECTNRGQATLQSQLGGTTDRQAGLNDDGIGTLFFQR